MNPGTGSTAGPVPTASATPVGTASPPGTHAPVAGRRPHVRALPDGTTHARAPGDLTKWTLPDRVRTLGPLDALRTRGDRFTAGSITVESDKPQPIDVIASARRDLVVWYLRLDAVVGGQPAKLYVNADGDVLDEPSHGKPFRTSGILPSDQYASTAGMNPGTGRWGPLPPATPVTGHGG